MNQLPAIAIGGPPHSGKSVLVHSLTQALRRLQIEHYVLRACPDGEGDWSNEAPAELVEQIRDKGKFTKLFVDRVCRDLARRNLPLLVDVGGRPQPDQEAIFEGCTHAILLVKEDIEQEEDGLARWRDLAQKYDLTIIAEYTSTLQDQAEITTEEPILQGKITGLERHTQATGPVFDALLQRVCVILEHDESELREKHLKDAPTELTLEVDRPIAGVDRAKEPQPPATSLTHAWVGSRHRCYK